MSGRRPKAAAGKKGPLAKREVEFIHQFKDRLPAAEIAKRLKRSELAVLRVISPAAEPPPEPEVTVPLPLPPIPAGGPSDGPGEEPEGEGPPALRRSEAWKQLRRELLPDELRYFEEKYDEFMAQFKDDVLAAEKTQIFKVIRMEIMMGRLAREMKETAQELAVKKKAVNILQAKAAASPDGLASLEEFEVVALGDLETKVDLLLARQSQLGGDYAKIEDKHQRLMEDLKATRKQRVDHIESGKVDYLSIVRGLATDGRIRKDSEHFVELTRRAYAAEVARLARPHRYADNVIDQPLLNSDTVGLYPDYTPPVTA